MVKTKMNFFIFIIFFILSLHIIIASQTNSSNYNSNVIFSSGGENTSSSNYQSGIALGTVSGNSSSSSFRQTTGFFSCVPKTCSYYGYNCDSLNDGCGVTLNCGSCASGYTCSSGICTAVPISPGGGVGVTGGGAQEPFKVDKTLIKTLIRQGDSARETIEITNNLDSALNIEIESSLKQFMVISEESFSLTGKSSKTIFVDIFAKEKEIPDAYTGKIIITGNNISKIINLIIEIKERQPLFDVIVDVLTKEVSIGDDVKARLKVYNLGDLNNIDIFLYYAIKDFDGKTISFKEESLKIDNELDIVRRLKVPENIPFEDYVFYLKVSYLNITASSTETFEVVETKPISLSLILLISGIVLIVIILILVIILFNKFHHHLKARREIRVKRRKEKTRAYGEKKSFIEFLGILGRRWRKRAEKRKEERQREVRLKHQREMRMLFFKERQEKLQRMREARMIAFEEKQKRLRRLRIARKKTYEERKMFVEERRKKLLEKRVVREAERRKIKLRRKIERTKKKEQKKKKRKLIIRQIKQKFLSRKIKKKTHEKKKKIKKIKIVNKKERNYHHMREKIDRAFFSKRFGSLNPRIENLRNEIRDKGERELELHKRTRRK